MIVLPMGIAIVTLTYEPDVRPLAYGILFGIQGTALVISPLIIPIMGGEMGMGVPRSSRCC